MLISQILDKATPITFFKSNVTQNTPFNIQKEINSPRNNWYSHLTRYRTWSAKSGTLYTNNKPPEKSQKIILSAQRHLTPKSWKKERKKNGIPNKREWSIKSKRRHLNGVSLVSIFPYWFFFYSILSCVTSQGTRHATHVCLKRGACSIASLLTNGYCQNHETYTKDTPTKSDQAERAVFYKKKNRPAPRVEIISSW